MASLQLEHVHKYYLSGDELVHAVRDASFELQHGDSLALLGPSGCGKSSTMRMVAGLEPVTYGTIRIDGTVANDLTPTERNVALAFESYALYQHMTVRQNIAFCLSVRRIPRRRRDAMVDDVIELLGIGAIADQRPSGLSGGQQQLVSLARAIVRRPNLTLLDEPISHLDTRSRLATSMSIRELQRNGDLTMVYVTHNQEEALTLADRIAVMNMALIQQIGSREEIIDRPNNVFVARFVGDPSINLLRCSVHANGGATVVRSRGRGFQMALPGPAAAALRHEQLHEVLVGIRPRDLYAARQATADASLTGDVRYTEFIGEDTNVAVAIEAERTIIAALDPETRVHTTEPLTLHFDTADALFFRADSQARIAVERFS